MTQQPSRIALGRFSATVYSALGLRRASEAFKGGLKGFWELVSGLFLSVEVYA